MLLALFFATHLVAGAPSQLVLEGSSNVTDWRCEGTTLDGQMDVTSDQIADFRLRVPVTTLRCGNRRMERDMYRALRAVSHPEIEFRFHDRIGDVSACMIITGQLSLAGETRTIAVEVEGQRFGNGSIRLRARLPLRMTDFSIQPPTALFGMVKAKDELVVQFDLILREP